MAGRHARRTLNFLLAAVMAVQLAFAVGHVHIPDALSRQHDLHHESVCLDGDRARTCTFANHKHESSKSHSYWARDFHLPTTEHDDPGRAPNKPDWDCELCWFVSILYGLLVPFLAYQLLATRVGAHVTFPREKQPVSATANELYRARAPPAMIAI